MISQKTKYALKALIYLSERYENKKSILISEMARQEKIPKKFLELILLELKNKGLLKSKKGKGGGYQLSKAPDHISVGVVMRMLEGPIALVPCVSESAHRKCDDCRDEHTCGIRMVMKEVRDATARIFDATTFQDILNRSKKTVEMYYI